MQKTTHGPIRLNIISFCYCHLLRKTSHISINYNIRFIAPGPDGMDQGRRLSCVYDLAQQTDCRSQFREPTGRCTNLVNEKKTWGMALTPFVRVLPQNYEDGELVCLLCTIKC